MDYLLHPRRFSLPGYPATGDNILLWLHSCLNHMHPKPVAVSTAKRYLKGVKASHLDRGLAWLHPLDIRDINFFLRGHLRLNPPPPPTIKRVITPLTVLRFTEVVPESSHENRVFLTASSVLSLRGRRGGELFPTTNVANRLLRWKHFHLPVS